MAAAVWTACIDDTSEEAVLVADATPHNTIDMVTPADTDLGTADAIVMDDAQPPMRNDAALPMRPEPTYGLSTQRIDVDGVMREYLLYVPESYDGRTAVPVMMNFHGGGMNAQAQMFLADMRPLAERENFILIYPEGTLLDTGDPHWNPLISSENNKSDADDFGFVAALLDALAIEYAIDADRVYATGYSNGAGFVYGLACYLSDRITGVAPVSGSMYEEMARDCPATHPTPIMIFNGTEDFERPYNGFPGFFLSVDRAVAFWTNYNQTNNTPTETSSRQGRLTVDYDLYDGGTNGVTVLHIRVTGGGHDWFDIELDGMDTNTLIWNGLSDFDRNGLR